MLSSVVARRGAVAAAFPALKRRAKFMSTLRVKRLFRAFRIKYSVD
jgi:hypothetical protein